MKACNTTYFLVILSVLVPLLTSDFIPFNSLRPRFPPTFNSEDFISFFTNRVINIIEKVIQVVPTAFTPSSDMLTVESDWVSNEPLNSFHPTIFSEMSSLIFPVDHMPFRAQPNNKTYFATHRYICSWPDEVIQQHIMWP